MIIQLRRYNTASLKYSNINVFQLIIYIDEFKKKDLRLDFKWLKLQAVFIGA